jgi:hypothetical protein
VIDAAAVCLDQSEAGRSVVVPRPADCSFADGLWTTIGPGSEAYCRNFLLDSSEADMLHKIPPVSS